MAGSEPHDRGAKVGTYFIETWGCQMNVLDSDKVAGALERHGYARTEDRSAADVILLNTCAIREKAQEKVFAELGRLRALKAERPEIVLGVCGCVAQQEGERIFERAPHVDIVVGTRATGSLPILVNRIRSGDESARRAADTGLRDDSIAFPYDQIRRVGVGSAKAFVTVIEGCNHRCTFCVVPTTRGREICRDLEDILAEVRHLAESGVREVEFLGQTVNAYRDARGRALGDLLLAATTVDGIERIRFTTSHPAQMTDRLMDAMAASRPKLCPYLHLPVQSGSTSVLRAMRRGYDRATYLAKIDALRERIPEMTLGTDVIVGFPNETEADFRETLALLREVSYDTVYAFAYSERPGTDAIGLGDGVAPIEKLERLRRVQGLQKEIQERRNRAWIGRDVEVLVEGPDARRRGLWSGRSPESRIVNFEGSSCPGRFERVRIVGSGPYSLRGVSIGGPA